MCNKDFFDKFDLGELEPLIKEAVELKPGIWASDYLLDIHSKDPVFLSVKEAKKNLEEFIQERRFIDMAFYCRVTFDLSILDHYFAGDIFSVLHKDKSILDNSKKIHELISNNLMMGKTFLPKLTDEIEEAFDTAFVYDGYEFVRDEDINTHEISIYWHITRGEAIEALKKLRTWIKSQKWFDSLMYIGGHYYELNDIDRDNIKFFTIYSHDKYTNYNENK
jgi:hypothetical protein